MKQVAKMRTFDGETARRHLVTTRCGSVCLVDLDRSMRSRPPALAMTADGSLCGVSPSGDLISLVERSIGGLINLIIDPHLLGVMRANRRTSDATVIEPFSDAVGPNAEDS